MIKKDSELIGKGGTFTSPLRYPGGKGRLGPWLAKLIQYNRINGGWYVEPYAGGAGAAIFLLTYGYVDHIVINDLDPVVYAFWWAILNDTAAFLDLVKQTPVTVETWARQKAVHASPSDYSLTEVGFATFFLNRTNRSGILTGGMIGGKKQDGHYTLDARFNKADLSDRIRRVSAFRKNISLYRQDAIDLITGLCLELPERSLIYLDPPYFDKGRELYRNHYKPEDHSVIASAINRIKTPWLVTYDNCREIRDIYQSYQYVEFSLQYSTAKTRLVGSELMFYGNLILDEEPRLTRGAKAI